MQNLSAHEYGASLLEMMAVVLIVAIAAAMSLPRLQEQLYQRELDTLGMRFIQHAYFARQQALHSGSAVRIRPRNHADWNTGWHVEPVCKNLGCEALVWLQQAGLDSVVINSHSKSSGQQFADPQSGRKQIVFNAAGAARTQSGGFVANRLVMTHRKAPKLEKHLILASGGRWRLCNPKQDARACH